MQRSSQSIASLAAALAKAQIELSNPEKSLVGTIKSGRGLGSKSGEPAERIFRYAPLSSGLEIVRKTLGHHEIATVQTTAIDHSAGILNLTTVLAHASGEWIASDWPVCAISETATPRRMGAALTYARRYALFTLVGIAGEDDLDAPDLLAPEPSSGAGRPKATTSASSNGSVECYPGPRPPLRHNGRSYSSLARPMLAPVASAQLRDQLLEELNNLGGGDEAALWAQRSLPEKYKLIAADAQRVEEAFQTRLANFGQPAQDISHTPEETGFCPAEHNPIRKRSKKRQQSSTVDKGVLALPEPRRIRDREHIKYVANQPCLICGRRPSDAHHLRFAQSRALGRKVSDEFTVPLCRGHHRELHRHGDEAAWWTTVGVDPTVTARVLWLETHLLPHGQDSEGIDKSTAAAAGMTDAKASKRNGSIGRRGSNFRTKPIIRRSLNDVLSAMAGKPQ